MQQAAQRAPTPMKPGACSGCALYNDEMMQMAGPKDPDIVIVGDAPNSYDIKRGPFFGRGYNVVRSMVTRLTKSIPRHEQPTVAFTYALRCCPESVKFKATVETYNQCSPYLRMYLDRSRPKAIITLGTKAMRSVGLKGTVKDLRGGLYPYKYDGGEAVIIPTYDAFQLVTQPGLVPVVETDLKKALRYTQQGLATEDLDLRTPIKIDDVLTQLAELKQYAEHHYAETGTRLGVSVDMEASGLHAYDPTIRMIAISLSWADNLGLAFPYEHRDAAYPPEDVARIKAAVEAVLGSDKVSLLLFNAKFDHQWLVLRYKFDIPFATYDGMIAEHQLEEDKKGNYSLKALTADYFPTMGKYEAELKEALAAVDKERQEAYKAELAERKAEQSRQMLDFWLGLTERERLSKCAAWMEQGYSLGNYHDLIQVRTRKYKGEIVVLKKYEASVEKMLQQLAPEDMGLELPDLDIPEPEKATFEDIDLDVMLKYAAIDALVTRKLTGEQLKRFKEDNDLIAATSKKVGFQLPTKTLRHGMNTYSMPLCESLSRMEYEGVRMDRDRLREYITTLRGTLSELEDKLFNHVGYRFNTSSSSGDLRKILFDELGYPVIKRSKETNEPSTDAETLKELYDQYDDEFLETLMSHRRIDNCCGTFLEPWLARSAFDGRIHASFNQTMTATYRLSSSNPNLGLALEVVKPCELLERP